MSTQQINLYQPVFRKRKIVFSAIAILQILAVIVVALLVVFVFERYRVNAIEKERANLQERRDDMVGRLTALSNTMPERSSDKAVHAELRSAMAEQSRKLQAVRLLSQGDLGNTRGFSGHLRGLATHTVDGLWLTSINVNRPNNSVAMSGAANHEELLPEFLQKLTETSAFSGTEFRHVELRRDEDNERRLLFDLNTRAITQENDGLPVIQIQGAAITSGAEQ